MALNTAKGSIPLYMQIKSVLVSRITDGTWEPGEVIPSEIQLAEEMNVSQGTVRKAINELVETNIFVRRQGRGTFVASHDGERALFHFFHLVGSDGSKALPDCVTLSCKRRRASRHEASALNLEANARVIVIERIRNLDERPTIFETIALPAHLFSELTNKKSSELPNTLYEMYESEYGIAIHQADEKLRAVTASADEARLLGLADNSPLLEIERVALTLDGTPVELRISHCNTDSHHYHNKVS